MIVTEADIASVLMQHLPAGSYDKSHNTLIYKDVMAHSKPFADILNSSATLFEVIDTIPEYLLDDFEREYGLPLQCGNNSVGDTANKRIAEIYRVKKEGHILLNKDGLHKLMARYDQNLLSIKTHVPMQCIGTCIAAVNTDNLRFKVTLTLQSPVTVNFECLAKNYLPASLMLDVITN